MASCFAPESSARFAGWLALLQCGARVLPVNPQLPQSLLDALVPDLTLRFALDLEAAIALPELSPLQMKSLPAIAPLRGCPSV